MALNQEERRFLQIAFPTYAEKSDELLAIPGFEAEFRKGFNTLQEGSFLSDDSEKSVQMGSGRKIMVDALSSASTNPVGFVKSNLLQSMVVGNSGLATNQVKYLQQNNVPTIDINNLWQENILKIEQGQRRSKEGISPAQLTALGLAVILPGVGSAIGGQLLAAGLLPVGTTVATATAVGTSLASAAAQVAQGKSADEVLKGAVVGGAAGYVGAKVGDYLVADPGTVKNLVTNTAANIVAGKNPEDAVIASLASTGAGLAGGTVAQGTGSAVAGQVAAGTTAGLLAGQTGEQALIRGVGNIKADSLFPGSVATVPTEQQVLAGQQDLQNQLAPYESTIPPSTTAFDTTQDISDTSGFNIPSPTPQTPITGNTGGNMATYDEDTSGLAGFNTTDERISDDPYAVIDPTTGQYQYSIGDPEFNPYDYQLAQTAQQTATQSGLKVSDVLNFFKSNPNVTKGLIGAGVSAAGGLLTSQANVEAARISAQAMRDAAATAAEAQKFRPVGVTTRFGASQFGFDPTTGQLTSAGYQLTPELKAMQDRVMALTGKGLTEAELAGDRYSPLTAGAQGLFGLGQQYLAQSPEQVAADYMAKQQNLLAPSRERQFAQLQNQLFNTGRGGFSVGATGMRPSGAGGLGAASPEMEAYYNALAQQDAALAAQATQAGQQQVQFGAGLLGSGANLLGSYTQGLTGAYSPFSTGIGVGSSLESLGQAPLDIGAQLGGRSAQAGANVGQTLLSGGLLGARTTQAASGVSPFGTALTRFADSPEAQQALLGMFTGGSPDQYEQRAGVPFTQRNVYG